MLWLIQRDFLQGKTVSAMVADALAQQPNPHGDRDIQQVHAWWSAAPSLIDSAEHVGAVWALLTQGTAAKLLLLRDPDSRGTLPDAAEHHGGNKGSKYRRTASNVAGRR